MPMSDDIAGVRIHPGVTEPVEGAPTTALLQAILELLKVHYLSQEAPNVQVVLQAINALAAATSFILVGTGPSQQMIDFFLTALHGNIAENMEEEGSDGVASGRPQH